MGGCYCGGGRPSRIVQLLVIPRPSLRRALFLSMALHAVAATIAWLTIAPAREAEPELVDIEVAPPPPKPEALPPELERAKEPELHADEVPPAEPASTAPTPPGEGALDAGVDAPVDARPDARPDARLDARLDAPEPDAALPDGGLPDAMTVATDDERDAGGDGGLDGGAAQLAGVSDDAGPDGGAAQITSGGAGDAGRDAPQVANAEAPGTGSGSASATAAAGSASAATAAGSGVTPTATDSATIASATATDSVIRGAAGSDARGAGSGAVEPLDTHALAISLAGVPGAPAQPAVDGEPTTAGTAANLLSYFPQGHVVTALIRFDRLRGTEWSAQTERLLRPMPDYRLLFGRHDAAITDKLETLVISTPRPRDAAATTLVARTALGRAALRDFLGATSPVSWSAARGGLLGARTGAVFPGDQRLFLSPFKGWFVLAQPGDLGSLTSAVRGSLDAIEATGKLPAWLAGIRTIESESGDTRGPALVVTVGLAGKRYKLGGRALGLGLGLTSVPTPDRISLAMELVKQGWLVRGNLRFASEADAAELVAAVQQIQRQIAGSQTIQFVIGKPTAHVIANLAFAQNGARVSYATSISIADARALLAVVAAQLDQYFGRTL